MIDITLLRIVKNREQYDKVKRYIPSASLDKSTIAVIADIGKYFEETEEDAIDFDSFRSLFFTKYHKNMKKEQEDFYNKLLKNMEKDVPDEVKKSIINNLLELEFATSLASDIDEYQAGEEIDIVSAVFKSVTDIKCQLERAIQFEFATVDDSSVNEGLDDNTGLRWGHPDLQEVYRRNQPGDQTIIAARPGKGKTTFICQNNWVMSQDMKDNEVILWFNNESRRQKIMSRQIQSALGKTDADLHAMMKAGTLRDAYIKAMGRHDRVRVYDIHGKDDKYIEEIIESVGIENIGAMIFDMLDKVKFPVPAAFREDQRLEALYTWSRELGVLCECPVFPTSQISVEGAGLLFPLEHMLKDSKTGKQGACDGILMIGHSDDPMLKAARGISMPKTKQRRAGQADLMAEVVFHEDIGRFI